MKAHMKFLQDLVNLPTAPFLEREVIAYIRRFVTARKMLSLSADRFGNLLVTYDPKHKGAARVRGGSIRSGRPVLLAAHMDHPGFGTLEMVDRRHVRAAWRGWVQLPYFARQRVRFWSGDRWVRGRIVEVLPQRPGGRGAVRAAGSARSFGADAPPEGVVARVESEVGPDCPGMWDIPDAEIRDHCIYARACDDVAGLAAILSALDAICRKPIRSTCYAFFTRAEEVGFAGALAAVAARTVPRDAVVVAVECSKAIAGVSLGGGPVLRVGDKASVFTPAATAYCQVVAERLAARDPAFRFQRKLMDGGTCESTAYCHYGYDATGVCLPLGNYHNMDLERGRIGPEYIDTRDYAWMVQWFVALFESPAETRYDGRHPGLEMRLDALLKKHRAGLLRTARREGAAVWAGK